MSPTDQPARLVKWRRVAGFFIGVLLIGVAVVVVFRNQDDLHHALDSASRAPLWMIALALVLPLANAGVVSLSFWVMMRRFGRVPLIDMTALICSAWLLNYMPMRPGLMGRLAFHKLIHGISLKASVSVSVALALMSGLAAGHMLLIGSAWAQSHLLGAGVLLTSTGVVFWLAGVVADRSPSGAVPRVALRQALVFRYLDMLVWAARMWVSFAIIGTPIGPWAAVLIAAAVQIAYLFPLTGAGLGVVEWAVGFVASMVVVGVSPESGLAASLVTRAAELVIVVPTGLWGGAIVHRRLRNHKKNTP